ncbi:YbaK/EbsC family protein [Thioalkalicoccus limnaeus]|uniref:Cys-tRNA(Pro)/Cys-tRNA(Cys) deacylase n=1 Tax=Thioalkalicoccus limnaeus TaxID=120681 RepID=A0ABV4BFF4_9GAMM
MGRIREPVTPAVRALRAAGVHFEGYSYRYIDGGGTGQVARELGIDEHLVIKTLIMEDDRAHPMVVLMHGDQQVSTQRLARGIDARWVTLCTPEVAQRHSGYQVGGTSPFGLRRTMPVYAQRSIAALERFYINGGKRGFILCLPTAEALAVLAATPLEMAQPSR